MEGAGGGGKRRRSRVELKLTTLSLSGAESWNDTAVQTYAF